MHYKVRVESPLIGDELTILVIETQVYITQNDQPFHKSRSTPYIEYFRGL